ncbi:LysE family translocator [Roseovarius nubinhibens]|uniref:Transmembrane amino acid efflux protein n=1 Tax=Roseovarius nubinhibens (strain ATCC BAA-591 / DSM 15170 / ISM) TaxID=89187 RepID=A3SJH1_ROSNI|nr:LysE family translocator [Roseovarius nubinhibens]EAP77502.1 transmembrane amino acid efflux protein [Roseovarius nubinhibens ISM]
MWDILTGFDPALLWAFVGAGLLLNLTPGADFMFVSASGIAGGPRAGMAAAIGISFGIALHLILAAAGVSAMLAAWPAAYDAIRYIGAAYLVFLAVQAWRHAGEVAQTDAARRAHRAIWRGFVTNVLNPKTALFIFAFIPQFTDPVLGPVWAQILILGAIFMGVGLLFSLTLGAAAGAFAHVLRRRARALGRISAVMFGGLAARLVWD